VHRCSARAQGGAAARRAPALDPPGFPFLAAVARLLQLLPL